MHDMRIVNSSSIKQAREKEDRAYLDLETSLASDSPHKRQKSFKDLETLMDIKKDSNDEPESPIKFMKERLFIDSNQEAFSKKQSILEQINIDFDPNNDPVLGGYKRKKKQLKLPNRNKVYKFLKKFEAF